jgi:hypothetical protein
MPVTVTARHENFGVERLRTRENEALWAELELQAAYPREEGRYPQLLDHVVHAMCAQALEPISALVVTSAILRGTNWASYRNGRTRLASAAASYLTWLAPPTGWIYKDVGVVGDRRPLGWVNTDGELLIDLLAGGQIDPRRGAGPVVAAYRDAVAVRVLNLLAPRQSVVHHGTRQVGPLLESPWWFEGSGR